MTAWKPASNAIRSASSRSGRRLLRHPDGARASRTFRSAACARPPTSSPPPFSSRRRPREANVALGRLDARIGDAIVPGGRRDPRRRAARSVRRRRVPGRRRHLAQHERERGAGQPRRRAARRHARRRTRWCIRTITSTWASRPTTCSRRRRGWRCCSRTAALVDAARALAAALARKAEAFAAC